MKKIYPPVQWLFLLLAVCCLPFTGYAQSIELLPAPQKKQAANAISIGSGTYDPGTVVIGEVPPGSQNKPVLVFIHGYTGNADTWFGDNDMYAKAYYDGYRTAFAVVYPDRSMWANGDLFSQQLRLITDYFGVNEVVVVAHSKGGIDADAALVHYGANNKVDRVISLGSPHFGTPLADLAQSGWVWWLSAIFGQRNDATYVLQTGYMSYFRSITDGEPTNNTSFRTLGSGRYYGSLWTSGVYLAANGGAWWQGGNDGVVNYRDSKRPSSSTLSKVGYNHFDLAIGSNTWNVIKNQLPSSLARQAAPELTDAALNPAEVVRSNYQIVSGEGGQVSFRLEEGMEQVYIDLRQADEFSGSSLDGKQKAQVERRAKRQTTNDLLGRYSTEYLMQQPAAGTYTLESEGPFVAIISSENGGYAELTTDLQGQRRTYKAGESIRLNFRLADAQENGIDGATVVATIRRTANLKGKATAAEAELIELELQPAAEKGHYTAVTNPIYNGGIYNISIQAEAAELTRSLVHSVAVTDPPLMTSEANPFGLMVYPNPAKAVESLKIRYQIAEAGEVSFRLIDVNGREVYQQAAMQSKGEHRIAMPAELKLSPGLYLYQLESKALKQSGRLMIAD